MKPDCITCGVALTPENRTKGRNVCRECYLRKTKEYRNAYVKNVGPEVLRASRRANLLRRYRIDADRYEEMILEQGGGCAICGRTLEPGRDKYAMAIDHDHSCCPPLNADGKRAARFCGGCNRGILCGPCNRGIGQMQDDPDLLERAAEYLRQWNLRRIS